MSQVFRVSDKSYLGDGLNVSYSDTGHIVLDQIAPAPRTCETVRISSMQFGAFLAWAVESELIGREIVESMVERLK